MGLKASDSYNSSITETVKKGGGVTQKNPTPTLEKVRLG